MLPVERRIRTSAEFGTVVRRGARVRRDTLVVHVLRESDSEQVDSMGSHAATATGARAGLIVGRSVGNSVLRHRTSRRLRAVLATRLPSMPADCRVVVRALPDSASRSSAELGRALDSALSRINPVGRDQSVSSS